MIPYDEIDYDIRSLVKVMNQFPGIHTEFSCAGHHDNEEAYVAFRADSEAELKRLLSALPIFGKMRFPQLGWWTDFRATVSLNNEGEIRYAIRILASSNEQRFGLIRCVKNLLKIWLDGKKGLAQMTEFGLSAVVSEEKAE